MKYTKPSDLRIINLKLMEKLEDREQQIFEKDEIIRKYSAWFEKNRRPLAGLRNIPIDTEMRTKNVKTLEEKRYRKELFHSLLLKDWSVTQIAEAYNLSNTTVYGVINT